MPEDTSTEITRPSIDEAYGSLTWFDEQAITANFNVDIHELMESFVETDLGLGGVVKLVRAFEFVAACREGQKASAALNDVRKLTAREVNDLASAYLKAGDEEASEVSPDEPVTEVGKDEPDSEELI